MKKTIILYVSLLFISLNCLSQDTVELGDKKIKPVTEFNLIQLDVKSFELKDLIDQAKCKMVFSSLVPRQEVEFYSFPSFVAKEKGIIYKIKANSKSIGYFFENIDSKEKVRDLISWSDFNSGRILNSLKLYEKLVEELMKIKPEWVIEAKSPFNGFEVEVFDDNYYLAKYLYYGYSEGNLSIEAIQCLVDKKGHITPIESKIVIKGPEISKDEIVKGTPAVSSNDDEEALFRNALKKAVNSFGDYANRPKTDKSKRLFYYIYCDNVP